LRERDFEAVQHEDGISPECPLKYHDYQSYYDEAELLYQAHGLRGSDPTEPPAGQPYPHPPVSNEPRIQEIHDELKVGGYHPFPCPVGIKLNEQVRWQSQCIRCDTCDGFPCLVEAKSDADINCIRPIFSLPNVTLLTGAYVNKLTTNSTGTAITGVEVEFEEGQRKETYSTSIVVVACGAILTRLAERLARGTAGVKLREGLACRTIGIKLCARLAERLARRTAAVKLRKWLAHGSIFTRLAKRLACRPI